MIMSFPAAWIAFLVLELISLLTLMVVSTLDGWI